MRTVAYKVAGMYFTPEQLDKIVELWEQLTSHPYVTGSTMGYYRSSTVHLSPGVKGYQQGNAYRMPNATEIRALVLSDGEETAYPATEDDLSDPWGSSDRLTPITLTLVSYGDQYGNDYDAANVRALDGHPGVTVSHGEATVVIGEMSSLATAMSDEPNADDAIYHLLSLVEKMEWIVEMGLIDDNVHQEYEQEVIDESWDSYLKSDVEGELSNLMPGPDDTFEWPSDDTATAFWRAYQEYEGNEWTWESATDIHNARHDEAVRYAAETVLGWNIDANLRMRAEIEAQRQAEQDAIEARMEQWRDALGTAWSQYRTEFPLPHFERTAGQAGAWLLQRLATDNVEPTVEAIRALIVEQSEIAAHRWER